MSPIHADAVAGFEHRGRIETAHDRRDAQLPGDDGGVREWRAHIGHHCREAREEWSPTDVGGDRDEDFTRLRGLPLQLFARLAR